MNPRFAWIFALSLIFVSLLGVGLSAHAEDSSMRTRQSAPVSSKGSLPAEKSERRFSVAPMLGAMVLSGTGVSHGTGFAWGGEVAYRVTSAFRVGVGALTTQKYMFNITPVTLRVAFVPEKLQGLYLGLQAGAVTFSASYAGETYSATDFGWGGLAGLEFPLSEAVNAGLEISTVTVPGGYSTLTLTHIVAPVRFNF